MSPWCPSSRIDLTDTISADKLFVNPDCGLRHLPADVARAKLRAMVEGTAAVRDTLPTSAPEPLPRQAVPEPSAEQGA
ncbi:MAG: hypothetical protein ACT4NY_22940 [Pseudonocardiales bacterium]